MHIQTKSSSILIEQAVAPSSCVLVKCDSEMELVRLFGSLRVEATGDFEFPYMVKSCKQEFTDALILLVKEIDYGQFLLSKV